MKNGILKSILIVMLLLVAVVLLNASGILNKDSKRINSKSNLDKEEKVTYKADKGYIIYNNKLYYPPFNIKVENDHMIINGEIKIYKKLGFDRELLMTEEDKKRAKHEFKVEKMKRALVYLYIYKYADERDSDVKFKRIKNYFNSLSPIDIIQKGTNVFIVSGEEILIEPLKHKAKMEKVYLTAFLDYIAKLIRNDNNNMRKEKLKKL